MKSHTSRFGSIGRKLEFLDDRIPRQKIICVQADRMPVEHDKRDRNRLAKLFKVDW